VEALGRGRGARRRAGGVKQKKGALRRPYAVGRRDDTGAPHQSREADELLQRFPALELRLLRRELVRQTGPSLRSLRASRRSEVDASGPYDFREGQANIEASIMCRRPSFCESGFSRILVVVLMSGPHELYAHAGWKLFILHEIVLLHSFHEQSGVPRLLERAVNQRLGSSGRLAGVMSATSASRGAPRMPLPKRSRNLAVMRIPSGMEFSERTGLSPVFPAISVINA
jgi:hypothetical protein